MITERVKFESQGIALGGRIVIPDSGIARGGVVCVTGGGMSDFDDSYLEWQQFMVEETGLASLAFNARGMGDSEGSFRTDHPNFDAEHCPANSQASRVVDTINAHHFLRNILEAADSTKLGMIGGSMGGDIASHAIEKLEIGALVLRAPAAYPDEVHDVAYGPQWGPRIKELGGNNAALRSSNFGRLRSCSALPLMLIYSGGDAIIPQDIQDQYAEAVADVGGSIVIVGDSTTPHSYVNDKSRPDKDNPVSKQAREDTFVAATRFFNANLE